MEGGVDDGESERRLFFLSVVCVGIEVSGWKHDTCARFWIMRFLSLDSHGRAEGFHQVCVIAHWKLGDAGIGAQLDNAVEGIV